MPAFHYSSIRVFGQIWLHQKWAGHGSPHRILNKFLPTKAERAGRRSKQARLASLGKHALTMLQMSSLLKHRGSPCNARSREDNAARLTTCPTYDADLDAVRTWSVTWPGDTWPGHYRTVPRGVYRTGWVANMVRNQALGHSAKAELPAAHCSNLPAGRATSDSTLLSEKASRRGW